VSLQFRLCGLLRHREHSVKACRIRHVSPMEKCLFGRVKLEGRCKRPWQDLRAWRTSYAAL
jgi:hypothetical protein